ncbi:hypothetical protein WB401_06945 [Streptomyces brasiliscabiei]|uniref:Uncharacterized protein n=1 Tax=Streptomyces brasiliscabiei TaxID=2736302 RepID=A0ABU8G5Y6_9ACTN
MPWPSARRIYGWSTSAAAGTASARASGRQTIREGSRTAPAIGVCLSPSKGMLILDVVDDRIMYIEILDRPPMPRRTARP